MRFFLVFFLLEVIFFTPSDSILNSILSYSCHRLILVRILLAARSLCYEKITGDNEAVVDPYQLFVAT